MPTFIVLCNFDADVTVLEDEVTVPGLGGPQDRARALVEDVGGTLDELWLTTGSFDMVAVVTVDDVGLALAFLMAFASLGRVSTSTLTAGGQVDGVVYRANEAKTNVAGGGD